MYEVVERRMRGHLQPCEYCKREMRADVAPNHPLRATRDHYMPKSRRKGDDETIIVMACYTCNHIKADRFPEQWDRFMKRNPRWWEPRGQRPPHVPAEPSRPLPYDHSIYILKHGKKAYRAWVAAGSPEKPLMRPLRPDEPIPIEYDDPLKQAAFEAAYTKWGRWLLRVPQSDDAGQAAREPINEKRPPFPKE